MLQKPKGTQDIVGAEAQHWATIEEKMRQHFHRNAYQEIRTPMFEATELFERGVGEGTDIVNKEMYTFEKGDRKLSLRPEGTAGVVRSFIEEGMSRWPKPVKLYYMGPMYRYERPQAGRQRQFHQAGVELFGLDTPAADAEVIVMAMQLFEQLGLPDLQLQINNIGTPTCREQFKQNLKTHVAPFLNQLCEDCQTRYNTNPLRMLDCKVEGCKAIYAQPAIRSFLETDFSAPECQAHFQELCRILDQLGIPYQRNPYLVRGLDYYTKTVFEITSTNLGAQNTVCGGGRYNHLVHDLGGQDTPAVGWALGMERLMSLLGKPPENTLDFYMVTDQHAAAFALASQIRTQGYTVEVDLSGKGFGKQFEKASKLQPKKVLILGEAEAHNQQIQQKDLQSGLQEPLSQSEFLERLGKNQELLQA